MKIYIKLDEEQRIIWYSIPFDGEIKPNNVYEADVDLNEIILGQTKLIDGILQKGYTFNSEIKIMLDEIQKTKRIDELKEFLEQSDFKILKCYEAFMLQETLPYDLPALVAERRAWRKELNEKNII